MTDSNEKNVSRREFVHGAVAGAVVAGPVGAAVGGAAGAVAGKVQEGADKPHS